MMVGSGSPPAGHNSGVLAIITKSRRRNWRWIAAVRRRARVDRVLITEELPQPNHGVLKMPSKIHLWEPLKQKMASDYLFPLVF
jgi:hypothetical protein